MVEEEGGRVPESNQIDWRDISTAPRDGTPIIAIENEKRMDYETGKLYPEEILVVHWMEKPGYWGTAFLGMPDFRPTHWIPLPPYGEGAIRASGYSSPGDLFTSVFGNSYTPRKLGRYEGSHPVTIRKLLERDDLPDEARDVISALIWHHVVLQNHADFLLRQITPTHSEDEGS